MLICIGCVVGKSCAWFCWPDTQYLFSLGVDGSRFWRSSDVKGVGGAKELADTEGGSMLAFAEFRTPASAKLEMPNGDRWAEESFLTPA